ncbi:MAG: bifunctional demethylmenaquinone methyltransferase/2-methoxy-6-polyprenyl-1,4-benzoquinol methylase UbiE [Salibacteraceae bacterium]
MAQDPSTVTPYHDKSSGKKEQVAEMFDNIAGRYDFLNHFLSLGIDITWRRKAIRKLRSIQPKAILDIATGTGDFAVEASRLKPNKIVGVDISHEMLEVGRKKMVRKSLENLIDMRSGDSENLQFEDNSFDAITVAFGVRNFENLDKGLSEMHRVLRPGGKAAIIEFSRPRKFPVKQLYFFYFLKILPAIGRWFSKDARAYSYLPESVQAFPDGEDFIGRMHQAGFKEMKAYALTFGIATLYMGSKTGN